MKFIENIEEKKYEKFIKNHKTKSHFLQSIYYGKVKKLNGFKIITCGLENENNELEAACLIQIKRLFKNINYFYIPRGYVLDYTNKKLIEEMTNNIKVLAKKYHAIFVKIDPDIKLQEIDKEGNKVKDLNIDLVNYLKSLGYKHVGYTNNFETKLPRFTFRLDITKEKEEIRKNMHATTRKILNRKNQYHVNIYKGNIKDLDKFDFCMNETNKRQNIVQGNSKYYRDLYEILNKNKMSDLYIVEVDIKKLKEIYKEKIKEIDNNIKITKEKGKLNDLNNQLIRAKKDYEEILPMKDEIKPLAAYITVKYNNRCWTLTGGNANYLRFLNANYLVYEQMIMDAKDEGYKEIDFFGTIGKPKEDNSAYGIHLFKERLGGEYTEFIGEFDLIINKTLFFLYYKLAPIYNKIIYNLKKIIRKFTVNKIN